ncbi:cobalt-zinc-cadmium efflux system protein [Tangfeifania diversioriginum]|uniref:Cobalt-zinc-cadmium efflux system protein n=1 Tax=Tangfeifania diversioriginum TaxID=1168035 RepID=A0A1M6LZJ1_9BACT|nr:cation diffusion facilitator family transporter [Tangfeifania diversioriginum]SHJ76605.1 cobalt-zinc-cadmium efflux system protein [Tangfeifania diversioriginum]
MAHSHGHTHQVTHGKAFAIGIALNIIFVAIEIVYGLIANSSALLADAGHNASDVLGLAFAWAAAWLASLKPSGKYTYGLRKTTILVSILNAILLFGAVTAIGWDAVMKLQNPQPVGGTQIMIVAGIGVVINTITALLFIKGQKDDLNIRGAFLHMAADAGVSLGVVVAGLLILLTGKLWIDPVMSFIIIAVILWGTWKLFSDSVNLALDAVPKNIDVEKVRSFIEEKEGVENLHDLHIWAMSTTQVALTAHLVMPNGNNDRFITDLQKELSEKFNIGHTTFQIENSDLQQLCDTDC